MGQFSQKHMNIWMQIYYEGCNREITNAGPQVTLLQKGLLLPSNFKEILEYFAQNQNWSFVAETHEYLAQLN